MIKNKIIEFIQIDSSLYIDTIVRGLSCLYNNEQKSYIVVDLRSSTSSILWTIYEKKNIKYVDDIINIISDINLQMFKTYFNLNSDIVCSKNPNNILNHKHLFYFLELLTQVYDFIFFIINKDDINNNENLLNISNNISIVSSNNPISVDVCKNLKFKYSKVVDTNTLILPTVFQTQLNYKIEDKDIALFSFDLDVQKEITNTKFLFNDTKNEFVVSLNKFKNMLYNNNNNVSLESIYEQQHSYEILKDRLHNDLIKVLDTSSSQEKIKQDIVNNIEVLVKKYEIQLPIHIKQKLTKELCDDIAGLGVLEDFINDETITEIMVNGTNNIYIEKNGKIQETNIRFQNLEKLKIVIDQIASRVGRHIDEASPIVDARLKDGSRVNAVISPIALDGHTLTIRKFSKHKLQDKDLISYGSISKEMIDFLKQQVKEKKNILISGGTGTGKTTLLNVISSFIGDNERIITIEDSAELQLHQKHVIRLETRAKSIEGTSEITIRQLVVNSLRMRPDRIIVGECRAGETIDMLQAMNTGHSGSLTTVHSNSPQDAISRLVVMSLMSSIDLPQKAIVSMIVSAINIIVQIKRCSDGTRKVQEISLLKKSNYNKEYEIVPVFIYNEQTNSFINLLDKTR